MHHDIVFQKVKNYIGNFSDCFLLTSAFLLLCKVKIINDTHKL